MPRSPVRPLAPPSGAAPSAGAAHAAGADAETVTISCDDCVGQGTAACDDCVVTFICGPETGTAVVIDVGEARAMRALAAAGLVPRLRHARAAG